MEPMAAGLLSVAHAASKSAAKLRLRAAEVLATSLDPSEKRKLLKSIGAQEVMEKETRISIGEAVAVAVAQEAERGKKNISEALSMAENAAKERVLAEMKMLKERQSESYSHTLLGPCLLDLGYKHVYVSKASDLTAIPVWEKQRSYSHERANQMVKDKIKNKHVGLPGVIALHEDGQGNLSIIDGQHRVGMMALMKKKSLSQEEIGFDLDKVLVEVFPNQELASKSFAEDVFTDINKAEPIKLVDMPGVASVKDRKIITDAVNSLLQQHPEMFKTSQRCRPPHLNLDNLRDALFSSDVLKRQSFLNSKELLEWITEKNAAIKEKFKKDGVPPGISNKVFQKAQKFKFFLGIESTWLYQ